MLDVRDSDGSDGQVDWTEAVAESQSYLRAADGCVDGLADGGVVEDEVGLVVASCCGRQVGIFSQLRHGRPCVDPVISLSSDLLHYHRHGSILMSRSQSTQRGQDEGGGGHLETDHHGTVAVDVRQEVDQEQWTTLCRGRKPRARRTLHTGIRSLLYTEF